MATTAHEVSLGVKVESAAAEASLRSLTDNITNVGAAFNGTVLSQIQRFNNTIRSMTTAVSAAGPAVNSLAAPLASLSASLSTFSSTISSARIAPFLGQLSLLTSSLNNVDATRLQSQVQAISSAIAPGIPQIREYAVAIRQVSNAVSRLSSDRIDTYFSSQVAGVTNLVGVLRAGLPSIQNYATALRGISRASAAIGATSSSLGSLAAQAAGLQLLANTVSANIGNIQAYAAAMRVLGTAISGIGRGAGSISRLVTGMASLAASASTVLPSVAAITAALPPFTSALRSAATASGRLVTRLTELQSIGRSIPGLFGAGSSSMGIFGSILQVAGNSVSNQNALLRQLGGSMRGVANSGRSIDISSNADRSSSAIANMTSKLTTFISGYIGVQALKGFGENILKTGAGFDNAMGMVKAVSRNTSDYSQAAFMAMEREAFRMGRTTTYSATQAAEALKELTQGGLTTQQAIQSLGDTLMLAETEAMSMADASRIVTSMMAQFQASASELGDYVDKLAKTSAVSKTSIDQLKYAMAYVGTAARSANQPFAEVVSAIGALSTAGVESSQAGTTLRDMLSDLTDTSSYASRKLQGLGFDMAKLNPRANNLSSIIGTLKARGVDAADAMAIFGVRGGLAAGSLITVYKQYLDVLNAVQNQSKGTAAIMQQDVTSNLRKDFDKLTASWDYLVNRIFKSGFGDVMRKVTQEAKQLTLQTADFVDTLKNASQFNALPELIKSGLIYAFGTAINYLAGGLVTAFASSNEKLLNSFKVLTNVAFWKDLGAVLQGLGLKFSGAIKDAMADLMDANKEFGTTIIQNMMYAGDVLIDKMEKAGRVLKASPEILNAKLNVAALQDQNTRYVGSKSKEAGMAAYEYDQATRTPGADVQKAYDRMTKASDALNNNPFSDKLNLAIQKLESIRSEAMGPAFAGKTSDYRGAAEGAMQDITNTFRQDAEAAKVKVAAELGASIKQLADGYLKGMLSSGLDKLKDFKPINIFNVSEAEIQYQRLLKENRPSAATAPTKLFDKVTTGKVGMGVGEIKLPTSTSTSLNLVVGSMKELGSGIWTSKFGAAASPLERATNLNTAATNNLTAAITRGTAGADLKDSTKGITKKPSATAEPPFVKTDLDLWARTNKMPQRLKDYFDSNDAKQIEAEKAKAAEEQRAAEIEAQKRQRASNERLTSTFTGGLGLTSSFRAGVKRGLPIAFDEYGEPIKQTGLSLGQPLTSRLGYTAGGNDITTAPMLDFIGQLRRSGPQAIFSRRSDQASRDEGLMNLPNTFVDPIFKNLQTTRPIDEDLKKSLLYDSPLNASGFGPTLGMSNTPDMTNEVDRNGQQQLAELSNMSSILGEINSNIVKGNRQDGQKLSIKIT